jgi:uncharacterized protein YjlB
LSTAAPSKPAPKLQRPVLSLFERNGWTGAWTNGIYRDHHYHSNAREVLGIVAGRVRVELGGEGGQTVELATGDVVVIPAGVAHKNEGASPVLLVVGAYPRGQSPDMRRLCQADHAGRCRPAARRRPG